MIDYASNDHYDESAEKTEYEDNAYLSDCAEYSDNLTIKIPGLTDLLTGYLVGMTIISINIIFNKNQ